MKSIKNFAAQQLTKTQMSQLSGGISRKQYCDQLVSIMDGEYARDHWTDQEWENGWNAYKMHCYGRAL